MTDFELLLACLLIPAAYVVIYIAGKYDMVTLICKMFERKCKEFESTWTVLTDDEESYPECFEYVLIEDDIGDKNVACCYPDYEWYISNGENSLKLIGEVIKWKKLD